MTATSAIPQSLTPGTNLVLDGSLYVIGNFINSGHFGSVYACNDRWLNELAIKVIAPLGRPEDEVRAAVAREARNLINLRHPNITYIYNVHEHDNVFYIVVERCVADLRALFRLPNYNGELWLPSLARDILQAIDFIHRQGFVHKDLHPGNIFIAWTRDRMVATKDPTYSYKVGDLGITREESNINIENTLLAQWMLPPEALDSDEFGPIGREIDVYHIGLVLLSVLLGCEPSFTKDEVLAAKPRTIAEQMPSVYAPVIASALRRHAQVRPSIAELWDNIVNVTPPNHWPI